MNKFDEEEIETHSEREIKKGWYKGEGEKKGHMKGPGKQEENR